MGGRIREALGGGRKKKPTPDRRARSTSGQGRAARRSRRRGRPAGARPSDWFVLFNGSAGPQCSGVSMFLSGTPWSAYTPLTVPADFDDRARPHGRARLSHAARSPRACSASAPASTSASRPSCSSAPAPTRSAGRSTSFTQLSDDQKRRGVICSSAGNHAQGVALAARIHGIKAVVVHGRERDAVEDRGDASLRRRGRAARHRSGTRPTRRRSSSSPSAATPTSIRSTTSS